MTTTEISRIRELVTEKNWNVLTNKTGEEVPPYRDEAGWHRKVVLDDGEYRKELFVTGSDWAALQDEEWFLPAVKEQQEWEPPEQKESPPRADERRTGE